MQRRPVHFSRPCLATRQETPVFLSSVSAYCVELARVGSCGSPQDWRSRACSQPQLLLSSSWRSSRSRPAPPSARPAVRRLSLVWLSLARLARAFFQNSEAAYRSEAGIFRCQSRDKSPRLFCGRWSVCGLLLGPYGVTPPRPSSHFPLTDCDLLSKLSIQSASP